MKKLMLMIALIIAVISSQVVRAQEKTVENKVEKSLIADTTSESKLKKDTACVQSESQEKKGCKGKNLKIGCKDKKCCEKCQCEKCDGKCCDKCKACKEKCKKECCKDKKCCEKCQCEKCDGKCCDKCKACKVKCEKSKKMKESETKDEVKEKAKAVKI